MPAVGRVLDRIRVNGRPVIIDRWLDSVDMDAGGDGRFNIAANAVQGLQQRIDHAFGSVTCAICGEHTGRPRDRICGKCRSARGNIIAATRAASDERAFGMLDRICSRCTGAPGSSIGCSATVCPVYPKRVVLERRCRANQELLAEFEW